MFSNTKGQGFARLGIGLFVGIVVVGIVGYIGFLINDSVQDSIDDTGFSTAENTSYANLQSNVLAGYDLGGLLPLVFAAAAVITVIGSAFAFSR